MKIGFIGTGVIAEAIIVGMSASDFDVEEVLVSVRGREVSDRLARQFDKVRVCNANQDILDTADLVFLAVLPHQAEDVVTALQFKPGQTVVSVIATLTAERLAGWIGTPVEITRAIPLPTVADGRGVTAIFPHSDLLERFFSGMGRVVSAPTLDAFDSYAIASSTMGTYFGFLETVSNWMQKQGTDPASAKAYLDTLFFGLASTSRAAPEQTLGDLRVGHSTPGGLNEQLFLVFDAKGGGEALTDALGSVADRVRGAR